jgi:DNA-binding response OmpR family regulator
MPGLSKVIVLDPDVRAGRQIQLGFEREGVPTTTIPASAATLEVPGDDTGLVVVGGVDGQGLDLIRRSRAWLDGRRLTAPILFAGRGIERSDAEAAGANEVVLQPAYLRDVVTIGRLLLLGSPSRDRTHLTGSLAEVTGVFTLVRALAAIGRSATLSLNRGLRRGEIRFYHGEVTSAQVGMIHGQAALHQLLLWTDARFDFHPEDIVRRQQIPLSHDELFADAERFLDRVRDSSGGLSPSMVLEQDVQRVQSFGKQIPTEVYGVLRMFDGYRVLADVLEDSAYRVFETLRVAQRAVEVGLLRVTNKQPQRVGWRAILSIEEWLIGSETRDSKLDSGPISAPTSAPVAREPGQAPTRDQRGKGARKPRRKKKRRLNTPVAIPAVSGCRARARARA